MRRTPRLSPITRGALAAATLLAVGFAAAGQDGTGGSAPYGYGPAPAQLRPAGAAVRLDQAADDCDVTRSVPASSEDGPAVKAIKDRKTLVIGVDQNSYRWGARNPSTGEIEGFDIDLARAIGTAIMGSPDKVTLKTVPTAERIRFIQEGKVDLIVRTMTITCDRLKDVAFSKPYFRTGQRVLVPKSLGARTIDEALKGRTACAASKSSAEEELRQNPRGSTLVTVENQLDCLVLMQLGKVDATMTDDGLAAGQAAQDQTVTVLDQPLRPAVMGVAAKKENTDLVARVNQVLNGYLADGWEQSFDRWLKPTMHEDSARFRP
ncbi:glutamate ABC transporter substrate-binding protein [Kitasatospora sp. NPDC050543]|uniref:glutamate ABC transporter substrate-binding protein n=1 Tax=Kitasatospora sp. NPDC050543 TaxID=3364054 RepID=UPI0037A957D3